MGATAAVEKGRKKGAKMFGIGMTEMLVICGVLVMVFGPKQLPKLADSIGKSLYNLRAGLRDAARLEGPSGDDDGQ